MRLCIVLAGLCTALSACQPPPPAGDDTGAPPADTADVTLVDVTCDRFADEGLAVRARSRPEFARELGEPLRMEVEATPNRHDPSATDTIIRLHYAGLTAQIRRPASGSDMVEHVDVTENRHLRYPALGIGAPAERIVDAFGTPRERTEARMLYDCGREIRPEEPVLFLLDAGRVETLRFTYYVD